MGESRGAKPLWQGSGGAPPNTIPAPFLARKGAGGWSKRFFSALLDEVVDRQKLHALFGRLDHDGTLGQRYQALTGKSP